MPFQPSAQFSISAVNTFSNTLSDISVGANGTFVATWIAGGNAYARRFSAAGTALDATDILVGTAAPAADGGGNNGISVAVAANGSFIVAYRDGVDAYVQRYSATGVAAGARVEVGSDDSANAIGSAPDVATYDDGSFVVATQYLVSSGEEIIRLQSFSADGTATGSTEIGETAASTYYNFDPSVDVVPTANGATAPSVVVSWRGGNTVNNSDDIYYAKFSNSLTQLDNVENITKNESTQSLPSTAVDASGNFVIAWQDGQGGGAKVLAVKGTAGGVLSADLVIDPEFGAQTRPSVASTNDGRYVVAYNKDGQGLYQFYSASGVADSPAPQATLAGSSSAVAINGEATTFVITNATDINSPQAIQFTTPAPTIQFSAASYQTAEGTAAAILLTRTGDMAASSQVQLSVTGGTATAGDYASTVFPLTVSFAAGETSKTISLATVQDTLVEPTETITLSATSLFNAAIGTTATTTVNITDDDVATPIATPVPTPVPTPIATPVPTPISTPRPTPTPIPGPTPVPANPFIGGNGNDILVGTRGSNTIIGNAGDDTLTGKGGRDIETGGTGKDRFVFDIERRYSQKIMGTSVVTDFFKGEDLLVLDRSTFAKLKGDGLKRSDFASVKNRREASRSNALFTYVRSNGGVFYNENRDLAGFGKGGKFADLTNGLNLSGKDFSVIK